MRFPKTLLEVGIYLGTGALSLPASGLAILVGEKTYCGAKSIMQKVLYNPDNLTLRGLYERNRERISTEKSASSER